MILKKIFLLSLIVLEINSINYPDSNTILQYAIVLTVPNILGYATNKLSDEDDHINPYLIALSSGSAMAAFDQICSLNPKSIPFFTESLKKSIALLATQLTHKILDRKKNNKNEIKINKKDKTKKRNLSEIFNFGLVEDTFLGSLTKYILIFKSCDSIISNILNIKDMFKSFDK